MAGRASDTLERMPRRAEAENEVDLMRRSGRLGQWRWRGAVLCAAGALAAPAMGQHDLSVPEWARSFGGESTFTEPSQTAVMGFDQPTSIREVAAVGGQVVKLGDLLVRGDDAEDLALYETQKIQVADNLDVQRLQKIYELRKVQYELTKESFEQGAGSPLELDERRATMEVAEVELRVGEMEFEQAKITLERLKARLDRIRLYAPFDGIVETVSVDVGQSVGEEDPVLRVVNIDALRMDVAADTDETLELGLKPGDRAWILIDVPGEHRVFLGRITEVSPVAYYATRQRRVRVEVPNPEGWPAGLPAWVRFTEPEGDWADKIVAFGEPAEEAGVAALAGGTPEGDDRP